jgi:uncharacterized protein (DUF362 family)
MKSNLFVRDGKALVSKIKFNGDVKKSVTCAVEAIGGLGRMIRANETVLLKPNFNTSDPLPGSSDPQFVKAVIELLWEHGVGKVVLGESSMFALSTREVMEKTGMLKVAEEAGAEVVVFNEGEWVEVKVGGTYLEKVSLPKAVVEAQRIVYVPCLKAHRFADFTMSLKLAVGFLRPEEKRQLHAGNLQEKIAELNTVVHPDIIILDGRRCFISGGPDKGEVREPNVILASGDRIAVDVESVRILQSYPGTSLEEDVWQLRQIRHAVELGLGVSRDEEYEVVEG